jgi:putative two-component system response regulator
MANGEILKGLTALVVDDDALNAKLAAVVLLGEGCKVEVARSAEEALVWLQTFRPDFIVLDLILPLMSGLLLAQRLKVNPVTSEIVLIALTVFNGPGAKRAALDAGFSAYFRKPIDPLSFPARVLECLRSKA